MNIANQSLSNPFEAIFMSPFNIPPPFRCTFLDPLNIPREQRGPDIDEISIIRTTIWLAKKHMTNESRTLGFDDRNLAIVIQARLSGTSLDLQKIDGHFKFLEKNSPSNDSNGRDLLFHESKSRFLMDLLRLASSAVASTLDDLAWNYGR